jgi:hypothetical protein
LARVHNGEQKQNQQFELCDAIAGAQQARGGSKLCGLSARDRKHACVSEEHQFKFKPSPYQLKLPEQVHPSSEKLQQILTVDMHATAEAHVTKQTLLPITFWKLSWPIYMTR